jgi:hypothetical protein
MSTAAPLTNSRVNPLAVVALVLGLVLPVLAIPVGHYAHQRIAQTGERGDGLALAGLVLGYLGLIAVVLGAIAVFAHLI